ncbi:MAG: hypothetical protein IH846_02825 [Acidobacteria bacterium]|nr:hypothetical protein [Acidobacteriota bacterium]
MIAAFVIWLGYRLLRLGLEKAPVGDGNDGLRQYMRFTIPGGALSLIGILFILGRDPLSLIIYLFTLSVGVGFGFAALGYRLFVLGVLQTGDLEAVWNDRKLLLERAAPGTLFALFGSVMIGLSLLRGPDVLKEYQAQDLQITQQVIQLVDERLGEGIALISEYLQQQRLNDR